MIGAGDGPLLVERGIGALVSLTERDPGPAAGLPDGFPRLHLPVPDMTAPALDTVRRAVSFIDEQIASGRAVAVHCGAGFGRTGTILACYLVHRGRGPEEAIREVRDRRPGSIETRGQVEAIHRFAATIGGGG
jgi:atypical dual specificity phosphatase